MDNLSNFYHNHPFWVIAIVWYVGYLMGSDSEFHEERYYPHDMYD